MSIYWSEFSWEACATLVAGLAAVGAAWWVGRNQLEIQTNQLEIQRRQTKLLENELKIQLLEKRTACVSDMRETLDAYMKNAKLSSEEMHKFHKLLEQAQLLFPVGVSSKLDEAITAVFWSQYDQSRAIELKKYGAHEKADERLERHFKNDEKVWKLLPELVGDLVKHTRVDAWEDDKNAVT